MRFILTFYFLIFLFSITSTGMTDTTAARAAFDDGTALFDAQEYAQAAVAFRRAYELEPSWKLLYNIAQCDAASRRYASAAETFERFLFLGADEIPIERRREVEAEIDRLRRLVGYVEIIAPDDSVIFINNEERGKTPLPGKLMVNASEVHDLRVVHEGAVLLSRSIRVSGTQSIEIEVHDTKEESTTSAPETHPQAPVIKTDRWQPVKTVGIVSASIGGALLVAGAVTGGMALGKSNELADECPDRDQCAKEYEDTLDSGKSLQKATNVLLVTGAILSVSGVALAIAAHKKGLNESIQVSPVIGKNLSGIVVGGRF